MSALATTWALLAFLGSLNDTPVILENGAVRLEFDLQTYSVRYLGRPGGTNFVDTLYLTERQRSTPGLVTPGGIMTDVLPVDPQCDVLRRGPAIVVEQRPDYILLLGPECTSSQLRVKKEYFLHRDTSDVTFRLSVLSTRKEEQTVSIRVTAQVPWVGALNFDAPEGERPRLLRGAYPGYPRVLESTDGRYTIPLGRRRAREQVVLEVAGDDMEIVTPGGTWIRRATMLSAGADDRTTIRRTILIDDGSQVCQIALEGRQTGVNVGVPLVFSEMWTLQYPEVRVAGGFPPSREGAE